MPSRDSQDHRLLQLMEFPITKFKYNYQRSAQEFLSYSLSTEKNDWKYQGNQDLLDNYYESIRVIRKWPGFYFNFYSTELFH